MPRYILIEVDEREILTKYFKSYEDAYDLMEKRFNSVKDKYDDEDEGEEWGLDSHSAWVNDVYGHNYDWAIQEIPKT